MRNNIEDVLDQPDPNDREILRQVFKNDKNKKKLNVFIYYFAESVLFYIKNVGKYLLDHSFVY